jgi:hypothetical protein
MKKLLALVSAVGVVAMMSGCGLTDPSPTYVNISIQSVGSVVAGGASGEVKGTIESDSIITNVSMYVLNSSDADVTSKFTISFTSGYSDKKSANLKDDMSTTVAAKSGTAAGTYKLKIVGESGGQEGSGSREFTVTSTGTPIEVDTVTVGSLDNATYGSSIDLDSGKVKMATDAKKDGSGIDIVCTYSTAKGAFRIFSPAYAKSSSGITAFSAWVNPNDTKFKKTSVSFSSVTTAEAIAALYSSTTSAELSDADAAVGDVFVVDTDKGYALIELISYDANQTGTARIKYGN